MFKWLKHIFNKKSDKISVTFDLENGNFDEENINKENIPERFGELQQQYNSNTETEASKHIWCLIGNIIDESQINNQNEKAIESFKHFTPNTKVYCFPPLWGDGYEKIKVIGRHKKTKRFIEIIIPSRYITNWRILQVFRPYILNVMHTKKGWTNSEFDKNRILELVEILKKR